MSYNAFGSQNAIIYHDKEKRKKKALTRWGGNASCNRMDLAFGIGVPFRLDQRGTGKHDDHRHDNCTAKHLCMHNLWRTSGNLYLFASDMGILDWSMVHMPLYDMHMQQFISLHKIL